MRLDKFVENLPHGVASLFNYDLLQYPAPYDELGLYIAKKAVRDFGGLKVLPYIETMSIGNLIDTIWEDLTLNSYEIDALNKIMASLTLDDESAGYIERRTYGESVNTDEYGAATITSNIGARSNTNTMGATDGTTTNTDTSYASTTGKTTTTSRTTTNQVINGSSSTAAQDSTTSGAHTDTKRKYEHEDLIERFDNIGEGEAPDYAAKWLAIKNAPVLVSFEKLIVDALTMPYYEEG